MSLHVRMKHQILVYLISVRKTELSLQEQDVDVNGKARSLSISQHHAIEAENDASHFCPIKHILKKDNLFKKSFWHQHVSW